MTKEQAITRIKHSSMYIDDKETADYIIKALEQPTMDKAMIHILTKENDELKAEIGRLRQSLEQPTSDDCVRRTQAIEWIENLRQMDKCFGNYEDDYFPLSEVIDRLKSVPPVTPTRKVGEWYEQNDDYFNWYECSECGYGSEGEMQYSSEYDVRTKFCPNCGAEMRLIDADKLLRFFTVDTANQTYRFGTIKKQIENAETVQAIIIPENTTNGDIIMSTFKPYTRSIFGDYVYVYFTIEDCVAGFTRAQVCKLDWWNAPYKRGNENGN